VQSTICKNSQNIIQQSKPSLGCHQTNSIDASIKLYVVGEGDEAPVVDVMVEEGEGTRGYLIVPYAARKLATSQKTANTTKWLESLRRKTRP
jgi:hypothetical protein